MRIYVTHCSAKKDDFLKDTGEKVTPDRLYKATSIQRFMNRCKAGRVHWAIFSDKYGVWFPHEKHEWYEKSPDTVTEYEFKVLVRNFEEKLGDYDEIYFYHNPGRFHRLYRRLLNEVRIKDRIVMFCHKNEIV